MANKIDFRLIVITDRKKCVSPLEEVVKTECLCGVKAFQLREKDLPAVDILLLAKKLRKLTSGHRAKLLINDRLDIALLSKADGIHSPENGILPEQVKQLNKNLIVGKSTHSLKSALEAERKGFDYIIFGPVYRTHSKIKYGKPKGLPELKRVCEEVRIPVFAVGGINPERAKKCIQAGAYGAAVIGAIMKSKNIKKTVNEFKQSLGSL